MATHLEVKIVNVVDELIPVEPFKNNSTVLKPLVFFSTAAVWVGRICS